MVVRGEMRQSDLHDETICYHSDNTPNVFAINKQGTNNLPMCAQLDPLFREARPWYPDERPSPAKKPKSEK